MEDHEIVSAYLGSWASDMPAGWRWMDIRRREQGRDSRAPNRRDFETVADALYQTCPPDEVTEAWARIVARERQRMGLPDPMTERSAVIAWLSESPTVTAAELVAERVYRNRSTADVMLGSLVRQGRIRRVGVGVYALGGAV